MKKPSVSFFLVAFWLALPADNARAQSIPAQVNEVWASTGWPWPIEKRVTSPGTPVGLRLLQDEHPTLAMDAGARAETGLLHADANCLENGSIIMQASASWETRTRVEAADSGLTGTRVILNFGLTYSGTMDTLAAGMHTGFDYGYAETRAQSQVEVVSYHAGAEWAALLYEGTAFRDDSYWNYLDPDLGPEGLLIWGAAGDWNGFFDGSLLSVQTRLSIPALVGDELQVTHRISILTDNNSEGMGLAHTWIALDSGFGFLGATDERGNPISLSLPGIPYIPESPFTGLVVATGLLGWALRCRVLTRHEGTQRQ